MTTLDAIAFTTAGSFILGLVTFIFFAFAIRINSFKVAPRCTARSRETVYNPKARKKKKKKKLVNKIKSLATMMSSTTHLHANGDGNATTNKKKKKKDYDDGAGIGIGRQHQEEEEEDTDPLSVQFRGGPMFGWIPWVMSLSYDQLIKGVPGTGTRKNGMSGSMLQVNLDGIVLLRFHAICLRVTIVATILALGIVLPINLTANCFKNEQGFMECQPFPSGKNLTNYEMTTIENIPILAISDDLEEEYTWWNSIFGATFKIFGSNYGSFLGRLYAIVLVSWITTFYCLHVLKKEWIDVLGLRRIYYLEGRHWENRVDELRDTMLLYENLDDEEEDEEEDLQPGALRNRRRINKGIKKKNSMKEIKRKKKKKHNALDDRPPWIPHPEQRDTVPNIELYSVLVGNIPAVPSEMSTLNREEGEEGDDEANAAAQELNSSIDWQLRVTTTFFDQCVPNQPGYSSSVAAVTMLPDAPKLAKAWKSWYRHCANLRRLRFVRELIAQKRHYDIDDYLDENGNSGDQPEMTYDLSGHGGNRNTLKEAEQAPTLHVGSHDLLDDDYPGASLTERERNEYQGIKKRINYYSNVFGVEAAEFKELSDFMNPDDPTNRTMTTKSQNFMRSANLMTQLLAFGPEQTAIYSKEFARGASTCCPNGCREGKIRQMPLFDLEEELKRLEKEVEDSYNILKSTQESNLIRDESDHKLIERDDKSTDDNDVEMQLYSRTPTKNFTSYDTKPFSNVQHVDDDEGLESFAGEKLQTNSFGISPKELPPRPLRDESPSISTRNTAGITSRLTLTNQGKVFFKGVTTVGSYQSENDGSNADSNRNFGVEDPILMNGKNEITTSSRRRLDTGGFSQMTMPLVEEHRVSDWQKVKQAVKDNNAADGKHKVTISSGVWRIPSMSSIALRIWNKIRFPFKQTIHVVDEIKSTSTFAVVTFTSRQAAVAARHCLSDGRGVGRWIPVEDIPVPPLADAAVCDFCDCRGCCRPVTVTIHPTQQMIRRYLTIVMLACIFIFYTLPLTLASALVAPEKLNNIIPGIEEAAKENPLLSNLLSGILPALFYSLFFALCPIMFKSLSNFGSNAVSVNQAEFVALQYYWWFMLITAFSGTSLTTMALNYFNERDEFDATISTLLLSIASALPRQVSATWLNWIIFRTFCTLPLMYMVNIHTFFFELLGWHCCTRCVTGGGPGGVVPYRIYIDSGVVFLCVMGLAPLSPLVAPAALAYFLYCAPLFRRNVIYMYRPIFDTGGIRWPFLADMLLSAIFISQVLLTTTMALKKALGPAILSGIVLIPVYLHRKSTRKKYLRSYMDAALLQTSQLDGWDNTLVTSKEQREEYRKFLVDAHRAAYVPICLAGEHAQGLTSEPAVVVRHPNDMLEPTPLQDPSGFENLEQDTIHSISTPVSGYYSGVPQGMIQPGASWRRLQGLNAYQDESSASVSAQSKAPPQHIHQIFQKA